MVAGCEHRLLALDLASAPASRGRPAAQAAYKALQPGGSIGRPGALERGIEGPVHRTGGAAPELADDAVAAESYEWHRLLSFGTCSRIEK